MMPRYIEQNANKPDNKQKIINVDFLNVHLFWKLRNLGEPLLAFASKLANRLFFLSSWDDKEWRTYKNFESRANCVKPE